MATFCPKHSQPITQIVTVDGVEQEELIGWTEPSIIRTDSHGVRGTIHVLECSEEIPLPNGDSLTVNCRYSAPEMRDAITKATQPGPVDPNNPPMATPTEPKTEEAAPTETPPATPAAEAHAGAVGVDLSQVEGTGKDGTITKADVAAAASTEGTAAPESAS